MINHSIKLLELSDIPALVDAFQKVSWEKPLSLFETYCKEQHKDQRFVWVARSKNEITGYVTLSWASLYEPFAKKNIPEIMDLNVLPQYRRNGIGSALLATAEDKAFKQKNQVGLGVGLYGGADGGYGAAQRLYIRQGYIPDGLGISYHYSPVLPGNTYPVDDDLILWFTKTKA